MYINVNMIYPLEASLDRDVVITILGTYVCTSILINTCICIDIYASVYNLSIYIQICIIICVSICINMYIHVYMIYPLEESLGRDGVIMISGLYVFVFIYIYAWIHVYNLSKNMYMCMCKYMYRYVYINVYLIYLLEASLDRDGVITKLGTYVCTSILINIFIWICVKFCILWLYIIWYMHT
jgi:hypothetical protein